MILSIGEILADVIVDNGKSQQFCGGAPFNLIVNAKKSGAVAGFIGRVGDDETGKFLLLETAKYNLNSLDIQVDKERKTTLALVTLTDGERDFKFVRNNTADYNIDINEIDFSKYKDLSIIHLGSLMLSEKSGLEFANAIVKKSKELNVKLSFDVNFRSDIFKDELSAKLTYKPFIKSADIVKFSDDELYLFTGETDVIKGCEKIASKGQLIIVTLGKRGSLYYIDNKSEIVPTIPVTPVDTTGAGDAFYGTFLAYIENKEYTSENLTSAMKIANQKGAETTLFKGAIKL